MVGAVEQKIVPAGAARAMSPLRHLAITLILVLAALTSGCGSDPVAVPNVVGIPLDDAHNVLAAKGFETFEDLDHFGDRSILLDANWVVLEQDPVPGAGADPGGTVVLRAGKIGEARTKNALPADSPVLAAMLAAEEAEKKRREQEAATEASEEARKAAEGKEAARAYVDSIDPALRLAVSNHQELAKLRREVARGDIAGDELTINVLAARQVLGDLEAIIDSSSPADEASLQHEHEQLLGAVAGFDRAATTLLSADTAQKAASLDRFDVVYSEAKSDWNMAVNSAYTAATVSGPPLVP